MHFLFWICWIFDLLAALFLVWACGFRTGFGASTGLQQGLLLLLVITIIGSLILLFGGKMSLLSLVFAALPAMLLLVFWIFSKMGNSGV